MEWIIRDREAGNEIDKFDTYESAKQQLKEYEESDKQSGDYTEDFYEIVVNMTKKEAYDMFVKLINEDNELVTDDVTINYLTDNCLSEDEVYQLEDELIEYKESIRA